jgi:hypothetical protein
MRKTIALTVLLLATLALSATDEPVTITGEVVDLHCYTTRGAHGAEHASCSNACIARDVPAGLVTADGTLYLLLNEKPVVVKEKIGKTVKATGKVVERSGLKALQLATVELQADQP